MESDVLCVVRRLYLLDDKKHVLQIYRSGLLSEAGLLKRKYRFKGFGLCLAANCSQDALFCILLFIFYPHEKITI